MNGLQWEFEGCAVSLVAYTYTQRKRDTYPQISHEGFLYHDGLEVLCRIRPNSQKSWMGSISPQRPESAKTLSERGSFQRSIYLMQRNGVSLISSPLLSSCLLFSHVRVLPMIRNELCNKRWVILVKQNVPLRSRRCKLKKAWLLLLRRNNKR